MVNDFGLVKMDDKSFARLTSYVTGEYGIKLPEAKKTMLEARLQKKIRSLGMDSYEKFLNFIFSEQGKQKELLDVIDLITTNKTDFFRERGHFHFLANQFIPEYLEGSGDSRLKIWSAGCSTGEEPYTLVIVLEDLIRAGYRFAYDLLATDISIRVIQTAHKGIYPLDGIQTVSPDQRKRYFLKSTTGNSMVRVKQEFRNKITYKRLNLMNPNYGFRAQEFDVIFCRNVLIYFDKATKEKVINKLCKHLKPGGILFLGHSESIIGMNVPLEQVGTTTYKKK